MGYSIRHAFIKKLKILLRIDMAMKLIWQSGPVLVVLSLPLRILQGLLPLLSLYLMKLIVDAVAAGITGDSGATDFGRISFLILIAGGVALATAILGGINTYLTAAQSQRLKDKVQTEIQKKSIALDLAFYENPNYFNTLHRAQQQGSHRPQSVITNIANIFQNGLSLLGMIGLLGAFNIWLAVLLFFMAIPGAWVSLRYSEKQFRWNRQVTPRERLADLYHWMITHAEFAKEVRLFQLGALFCKRFANLRKSILSEELSLTAGRVRGEMAAQGLTVIAMFGMFAYMAKTAISGNISLGELVMYFQAFQRGQSHLRQLLSGLVSQYENNLFMSYLSDFLNQQPQIETPSKPLVPPAVIKEGIRFQDVSFAYPNGPLVLDDVCLTLPPGRITALVGLNGSGKSTLIKLLCRLYDPLQGRVMIDGIDLREMNPDAWQDMISILFQDYAKYILSARENIWVGDIIADQQGPQVERAAEAAGIDAVLQGLPNGYDTSLSRRFQDGVELSEGQWQKVALARALIGNAQLVILDEPTSSLDALAEARLFGIFRQMLGNRTGLIISHRFSTVHHADQIAVLDQGRISEQGTHTTLLAKNGLYAKMYYAQINHRP